MVKKVLKYLVDVYDGYLIMISPWRIHENWRILDDCIWEFYDALWEVTRTKNKGLMIWHWFDKGIDLKLCPLASASCCEAFGVPMKFLNVVSKIPLPIKYQLMGTCWFGLVVCIPGIPLWKGLLLGCTRFESQTNKPNQQLAISWK